MSKIQRMSSVDISLANDEGLRHLSKEENHRFFPLLYGNYQIDTNNILSHVINCEENPSSNMII